eukprot:COSAG02_NODE_1954_length_10268_cov_8.158718_5_plen_1310_part_00
MSAEQDEDLSLIDEGLRSLRGALDGRAGLRVLNVHSNHLVSVADAELGAFPRLCELNLSSNDLCTLDGVQTLSTLEVLNVSSNRLAAIDVPIVKLTSLRSINLSYNRIASLAPLGDLGRAATEHPLASVQLQGNQLCSLSEPAQLRHFRHLSEVVFRRDSSGNPLCELPGYPSAILRDGLPACVACLDGVSAELLVQEPSARAVVSEPEAPEPKPVQPDVLSSPPPSPWVSVAGSTGTPPKVAAAQNGTPHIDAALNTFKSRHDGSRRTSDPGSVQTAQATAAAAKVAAAATSKRMLYALDQELRLEKLETHLAQIVAGIDIGSTLGGRAGHSKPDSQRKPYRPRLPVDPAQPGLGRDLQRPVANRRRNDEDAWSTLSEEDFERAPEVRIDQSLSLSTSDGSTEFENDVSSRYEHGDRHNPWGSKRKAAKRPADDPSRDKENFGSASAADEGSWSELGAMDGQVEDYGSTDDAPSVDEYSVTDSIEASGRDTSLQKVRLTQQQSRLLSPRRHKNAPHTRKRPSQHSRADETQSQVHDRQDSKGRKKGTDASEDQNAPAETTTVGALPNSSAKTRRPMTKTRQIELEKAYALEQEQVKYLKQKLEAIETSVANHAAQQETQTKALQEELETERVLRAEVQQLRLAASSDKTKAEAAAKSAIEKCDKEEEAHRATATALAEAQRTLEETTLRVEQTEQQLKQKTEDLNTSHQMETTLARKLKTLQETLHGLEEEWSAREAAADDVLGGLKADFERAKRSAGRAEEARAEAQEHADASARATQNAKQQAAALADRHNEVTGKLELDIEAYRRSESMLQQKLNDLSAELATEKQHHAELSEKQSSTHAAQVRSLMAEVTEHQKQQSVENNEQLVAQRQLMELEEQGIEQRKAALHKQQELELGMMQASNKVRELKELLRVSITKEARSASSSRELSLCVKALREKLLDRDDECTSLQQALAKGEADTQDQASRHTLAISALEVQLTTARYVCRLITVCFLVDLITVLRFYRNQLEDATEKLRQAQTESEDMRGEMSAKVAELQAAVDDQGAAAAHEANQRVAALTEELEEAESALKVKEAVCADQAKSLQLAKEEASKAEEVANRRLSELEDRTNSLEQEQELTADLRSQLLGKEREMEGMEEDCDRFKAQADEDEKMLEQYVATIREKDEMLSFIDQEVDDLKAMFTEKEQGLVDQLTKESTCTSETAARAEILEAENAQLLEAAAQHDATMARLVRAATATLFCSGSIVELVQPRKCSDCDCLRRRLGSCARKRRSAMQPSTGLHQSKMKCASFYGWAAKRNTSSDSLFYF